MFFVIKKTESIFSIINFKTIIDANQIEMNMKFVRLESSKVNGKTYNDKKLNKQLPFEKPKNIY